MQTEHTMSRLGPALKQALRYLAVVTKQLDRKIAAHSAAEAARDTRNAAARARTPHVAANLSRRHPDYGLTMAAHLKAKAARGASAPHPLIAA